MQTDTQSYGATSAPLIVKDKVLVGTSGGDDGVRGFVAAFDARPGKECGASGRFLLPVKKARKPGRQAMPICMEAVPPGCREPMILN